MNRTRSTKNIALLAALLLLVLSALSACTNKTNADEAKKTESKVGTSAEAQTEGTSAAPEKKTVIKAATGGGPKPYIFVNEDNEADGYDIAVLKAVFEQLPQYDLQIEVTTFDSLLTGVTSGNFQIAVNNLSYNAKRAESYLYTYPYDKISYVFVYKDGATPIKSFDDAVGKTLEGGAGVSITTAIETWNEKNPDKKIELKYTDADTLIELQHVLDGSNDFQIIDTAMYYSYVNEYGLEGLAASPLSDEDTAKIASSFYAYFLLATDNDALRQEIDPVLKKLAEDGTLTKLGQKYQNRDDTSPELDQFEKTVN